MADTTTLRIPPEDLRRVERIAARLDKRAARDPITGRTARMTRHAAILLALARGLDALETDLDREGGA